MKLFDYVRAADERAALDEFAVGGHARFLGGGTNLVDLMKLGVETPEVLVDVTHLPLGTVEETADGRLRIGATVDRELNPVGTKGIGEIGIVGTAAAIANAVHRATGARIRDLPITPDKRS